MSEPDKPVLEEDLHSLVDGQLDPARLTQVLNWLQAHPADAALLAQWQAQRLQLRQLHRALDVGPTPPALMRAALGKGRAPIWRQAAAAVLLLGLGLVGGRLWPTSTAPDTLPGTPIVAAEPHFVRDAVIAHAVFVPETRHPVEVAASDETHLVQWLTRRLGVPVKAPALHAQGFRLLGGRLLPGAAAPRAQFMYEDARGRRLTLYVTVFEEGNSPRETAFRSVREGRVESFYWIDGRLGYAFSADLPSADMMALARNVYKQLTP
jgi:anti-sigma factor RsiW